MIWSQQTYILYGWTLCWIVTEPCFSPTRAGQCQAKRAQDLLPDATGLQKFLCCFYFRSPRTGSEEHCRAMFQLSHRLKKPTEMPKRVLKVWQHKETAGGSVLTLIKTPSLKPPLHSLKQQLAPELINLRSVFSTELTYLTKLLVKRVHSYMQCD